MRGLRAREALQKQDARTDPWVVHNVAERGTPLALVTLAFNAQPRLYPYFVRGNACDTSWWLKRAYALMEVRCQTYHLWYQYFLFR